MIVSVIFSYGREKPPGSTRVVEEYMCKCIDRHKNISTFHWGIGTITSFGLGLADVYNIDKSMMEDIQSDIQSVRRSEITYIEC